MQNVIEIFKEITALNRCSGNYEDFISYIKGFSSKYEYECLIDNYNNILCKKRDSKATLCFQNHYDIVCLIDNNIPKIVEENGFFKAENSTLGADNGIGCSYMLSLMSQGYDCEFLFTSDEEIGLIGANNLEHNLNAKYMLNIDSEEEGEICIGCAGGVDIFGKHYGKKIIKNSDNYELYEIEISKLPGGHSGVNIHENRPNAIKLFGKLVKENGGLLLDINAGERINSIPVNVKAIVAFKDYPTNFDEEFICINKCDTKSEHLNIWSSDITTFIYTFANGVRAYDNNLNVVLDSINLAKIKTNIDSIEVELSARSMDNKNLETIKKETASLLEHFGFEVKTAGKYPAWKPDVNEFTNEVLNIYKTYDLNASLEAIHAGLECAIFKDKFPHMKIASIGPNIFNPHSNKESVEINSIKKIGKIVKEIADKF
ncbi:M20/M25/M40 family metallo-hydrolase [Halarcobacter bivalviorum]|uniref:Aminoacyl-histidine dipeptidase n=1 Tax=Halarcobacter bivalviorum TaxID=663364 RepID=A0AAX2ABM8_9BACT|nr:M20/M25/M40 family metallo-hydrolase [Halarcobacter bivalviorum]AXH12147.1 peptidase D [Halarcobacter bivalviorum]RXK11255.1 aminoacyl-histidine dipeptidase [Halarcobacter bivalviorum]